jgi:hypothetical protein
MTRHAADLPGMAEPLPLRPPRCRRCRAERRAAARPERLDLRADRAVPRGDPRHGRALRPGHLPQPARDHHRRADDGRLRQRRHAGELPPLELRQGVHLATEKNYKRGQMGLAYEIVINSNPCISYLMEENTMAMQALVIAHAAYGHNSFFKGNYLFRMWTDADVDHRLPGLRQELRRRLRGAHGVDAVEELLDSCHALMNHGVDRYRRPSRKLAGAGAGRAQGARGLCAAAGQRPVAHPAAPRRQGRGAAGAKRFPESRRRTCCTSSRRTRRCWNPGSARSCASCARWRSTSTRSARPR